jgi:chromosome segregation ATPase
MARVRAQATAEILAAQQLGATAAEEAARVAARLVSERTAWEADLAAHEAEADELRAALARSRDAATAAQDALEAAMGAHRVDVDERDRRAARAEARHEDETSRLTGELDEARTAVAAALARADAADHRAAAAEHAARTAAGQVADTDAAMGRLRIELATAQAARDSEAQRAERAEGLVDQVRAELAAERDRHDVSLAELHDQLAQLLARQPPGRPGTKSTVAKKRPG